jgi:ADP-heptose:LPS heptosyltransferase
MLSRDFFVSEKNYYLISFFDRIFKVIWLLSNKFGLVKNWLGRKNRVIFIGPTHLGDILLTTPAIRFAKQKKTALEIICIVSSSSKAVLANNPNITRIEVIDLPWFLEGKRGLIESVRGFFHLVKVLKKLEAETVINFSSTSYHREHLAMWLAGIPHRIGFSHKGFGYFLTNSPPFVRNELIARQKLRMIGYWLNEDTENYSLKPDYFISSESDRRADELLASMGFEPERAIIGINPSAQHNYLWPASHYIELCQMIYEKWQPNILFLGTKQFEVQIEQIRSNLNFKTFTLAGQTSLEELAAILKKIDLLITVDTGTRHIANAVGARVIVLSHGASSIYEFGMYVEKETLVFHEVSCSPCGLKQCKHPKMFCMTDISVTQCFQAVGTLI